MIFKLVLVAVLVSASLGQQVNRISIQGAMDSVFGCWFAIKNTEQILDLRTNCKLENSTEAPGLSRLVNLVPSQKAYYFKENGEQVRGYRYVKDTLNYYYQYYNFQAYRSALAQTLNALNLGALRLPFDERYQLEVQYDSAQDAWKLRSLAASYHTPVPQTDIPATYSHSQTMEEAQQGEKSLAKRFMTGRGDSQPINITLELSVKDAQLLEGSKQCSVVIEEILPEWFFISEDNLHTVDRFEVFQIQLPAHFSKQFFFRYTVPLSKFTRLASGRYTFSYPMNIRYPPPGEDYFVTVGLQPNDKITVKCDGQEFEVEEDLLFDRGHKEMFAGRIADTQPVTIATYAVTIIMCIWSLRKHKRAAEV